MSLNTLIWLLAAFSLLLSFFSYYKIQASKRLDPLRDQLKFKLQILYSLHYKLVEQLEENNSKTLFIHGYTIQECKDKLDEIKNHLFIPQTIISMEKALTKAKINRIDKYMDKVMPFYEEVEKGLQVA